MDDFFPNTMTGFRVAEFNAYLESYDFVEIQTTCGPDVKYSTKYPQYRERVLNVNWYRFDNVSLLYGVFLNNIYRVINEVEERRIPFYFTLYPGGGFGIGDVESNNKLDRVVFSPDLKSVVVTQKLTFDYLSRRYGKELPTIVDIYGVPLDGMSTAISGLEKKYYGEEGRDVFNVCFVANKYMPDGLNKGMPDFREMASCLLGKFEDVCFYIVGNWDESDFYIKGYEEKFKFLGGLEIDALQSLYQEMDVIVSPHHPFKLYPGNFDGFPTTCVVEAALCGVVMLVYDDLLMNSHYKNWSDIIIVDNNPNALVSAILKLKNNPVKLRSIGRQGKQRVEILFSSDTQIKPRVSLMGKLWNQIMSERCVTRMSK